MTLTVWYRDPVQPESRHSGPEAGRSFCFLLLCQQLPPRESFLLGRARTAVPSTRTTMLAILGQFVFSPTFVLVATPALILLAIVFYYIPAAMRMHAATTLLSFAPIVASLTFFCLDSAIHSA
jgi:hypothetical protein